MWVILFFVHGININIAPLPAPLSDLDSIVLIRTQELHAVEEISIVQIQTNKPKLNALQDLSALPQVQLL